LNTHRGSLDAKELGKRLWNRPQGDVIINGVTLKFVLSFPENGNTMRVLSLLALTCSALIVGCGESQDDDVVIQLQKLGGKVVYDDKTSGTPIVSVTFRGSEVTDAGLVHLKGLSSLQSLDLGSTKVTDAGLNHIESLTKLKYLGLYDCQVTDAGLEHLKGLTSLEALNLSYDTKVTGKGLVHLKDLTKLQTLNLHNSKVTDSGLKHVQKLTSLKALDLNGTEVTDAGVKNLQAALPECQIISGNMTPEKLSERNRKEGVAFLQSNGKKDGVKTTRSGLQYLVLKSGNGPMPKESDTVKTHYHGTLTDGTVFDSSVDRKRPETLGVNAVIFGWREALQLMHVGDKWRLFVPSNLAYGPIPQPGGIIGPNAVLIFEIELLEITK
jgi:FKBP-type peptidyl-prolyl cis-trans isomerase FklB